MLTVILGLIALCAILAGLWRRKARQLEEERASARLAAQVALTAKAKGSRDEAVDAYNRIKQLYNGKSGD